MRDLSWVKSLRLMWAMEGFSVVEEGSMEVATMGGERGRLRRARRMETRMGNAEEDSPWLALKVARAVRVVRRLVEGRPAVSVRVNVLRSMGEAGRSEMACSRASSYRMLAGPTIPL